VLRESRCAGPVEHFYKPLSQFLPLCVWDRVSQDRLLVAELDSGVKLLEQSHTVGHWFAAGQAVWGLLHGRAGGGLRFNASSCMRLGSLRMGAAGSYGW